MASLSLKRIYKKYDNGFCAVTDFNLEVADKEFVVFVGPSGCGKSTTHSIILKVLGKSIIISICIDLICYWRRFWRHF